MKDRAIIFQRLWALTVLTGFYISVFSQSWILAFFCQAFLFHAGHEAFHDNLFSRPRFNRIFGILGYSCLFHNFYILKSAHIEHHICGRDKKDHCLIDHRHNTYSFFQYIEYYASIIGLNYVLYIFSGFLLFINERVFNNELGFVKISRKKALQAQVFVTIHLIVVFLVLGFDAIFLIALTSVYWGLSQNVAHYALPVGGDYAKYASRTFRVSRFWELLFFGSAFRHVEHHVAPHIPGVKLCDPEIQELVISKIGGEPLESTGIRNYFTTLFSQLSGPKPPLQKWKHD